MSENQTKNINIQNISNTIQSAVKDIAEVNNKQQSVWDKKIEEYDNEMKQLAFKKRFEKCGVYGKLLDYSFENYEENTYERLGFKNECIDQVNNVLSGKTRCICLLGSYGIGKTHLAVSMLRAVGSKVKSYYKYKIKNHETGKIEEIEDKYSPNYYSIRYGLSDDFYKEYKNCMAFTSKKTQAEYIDELAKYDFICIDEIGRSVKTQDEQIFLFKLIDARYVMQKSTILISNLDIAEFQDYLGGAICDRLKASGVFPDGKSVQSYRENEFR